MISKTPTKQTMVNRICILLIFFYNKCPSTFKCKASIKKMRMGPKLIKELTIAIGTNVTAKDINMKFRHPMIDLAINKRKRWGDFTLIC